MTVLSVSACSTVYEGKYDFSDRWRKAEVVQIFTASRPADARLYDCVRKASPEERAASKFVLVKYLVMLGARQAAVRLAGGQSLAVGDPVYVQLGHCEQPLVRREPGPLWK